MSATLDSSTGLRFASGDAPTAAEDLGQRLEQLNAIGASLSAERDIDRLLEAILTAAKTRGLWPGQHLREFNVRCQCIRSDRMPPSVRPLASCWITALAVCPS